MQRFWTILLVLFLGVTLAGCAASKKKGGTVEVEDATIRRQWGGCHYRRIGIGRGLR